MTKIKQIGFEFVWTVVGVLVYMVAKATAKLIWRGGHALFAR